MISTSPISSHHLQQIYSLLQQAISSSDSHSQKQVYSKLSTAQQNPQFYVGLITIAYNSALEVSIREMALLTIKSALKRNELVVGFSEQQMGYMRNTIIGSTHNDSRVIANVTKSLISTLALWCKQINFQILGYLLQEITTDEGTRVSWSLETLKIILQDIKFQTENISCFCKPEFSQFLQQYAQIFETKVKSASIEVTNKYLVVMNLLLKYWHQLPNAQMLNQYLQQFLLPLLANSTVPGQVVETALEGLTQITELHSSVILSNNGALQTIVSYTSESSSIVKAWLSLLYDLFAKDFEQKLKPFLSAITPRLIHNFVFTKQDEMNVKLQMQEQNNPYQYELQQDEQQQSNSERHSLMGYTKRKLAVLIFKEMFTVYGEEVWPTCEGYLGRLMVSENLLERECGILMLGLIFEISEDHLDYLSKAVSVVIHNINSTLPDIVRCTSLWALAKTSYILTRDEQVADQIQSQLIKCLNGSGNGSAAQGQVRDTVYTTLDEFIRCNEQLPKNINDIVMSVVNGIRACQGKTLYSVLKICSTLYQRHSASIPDQVTQAILKQLCTKWGQNEKIQSIMSPILECLVTISSANTTVFKLYAFDIFKQAFKILENQHQKTVVLRSIDLLSSIISTNSQQINAVLAENSSVHSKILSLLSSEQNQIVNFTYGLLGDISKVIQMPNYAETYIQTIGTKFNPNNLTSCSNALTCLTDLIIAHPYLAPNYARDVIVMAINKINLNNLQAVYGFNFARIYARLGNVCPAYCAQFLSDNLKQLCIFLRAQQHQKLTDEAYRGLFNTIAQNPQTAVKHFEHLIQSFLCYPCQDKEVQATFLTLLKSYRNSLNSDKWNSFLKNPLFLPAIAKKIQVISR